ncbi:hypothetical protein HBI65_227790 [Parastagonospora nodorum]|nr:hypothetical protein HBH49_022190 [Parastagonospora nodorum]KAH4606181.1 hypothetical protein HBH82_106670 [Parastagonospora nodorum]KAH4713604.1 hypothetical protein HBH67_009990 [Parastagonospora nodorum]KAH4728105.1 hypothetical protein HBH78_013080 [Parastagonospora nodorum]KAH4792668.1 hypothetical protein HBH62_025190 [Parastagonospora nodorum]
MQPYPTSPLSNSSAQEGNGPAAQSALPSGTEPEASLRDANSGRLSAVRKSRVALACKRCKRRKQRCDGAHPCKSCERASVPCAYERTVRPQYPGGKSLYISALEERVAFLEARLPDHAEDHYDPSLENPTSSPSKDAGDLSMLDEQLNLSGHSHRTSISEDQDVDDRTSLIDGVAYLSLCASGTTGGKHEPYYVGSSSGATIARVLQSSIFRSAGGRAIGQPALADDCQSSETSRPSLSAQSEEPLYEFPDWEQSRMLFDVFFERIHTRWPLLDRVIYTKVFEKQYGQGSLTITERSILHLIYAITARFLSLTRKPCGVDYERQLMAATASMDHVLDQHDLATVQFLVLLGVHGQRSPYGAGAWSQVRYATSVCIEMGLHRKRSTVASSEQRRDAEIRRRVFWSCYCLDRMTSIVLGRAFAIADRDINVELPSTNSEFWSLTHQEASQPNEEHWSNIQPFIHIIKLDRIQSRIHKAVFRIDRDVFNSSPEQRAKLDRKMAKIRQDLDNWVQTAPKTPKKENKITWMYDPESAYLDARDFYGVQYHKAVLFLYTVFLPTLDTSDPRFITCTRSAACACNAYKRLSQNGTLTYTMISLHSCFVAGLTLVYCIWRDRSLFSYDALEATRACSQIMTIFGEKWPGAIKYRDIFDALSGSLFKLTIQPASTTSLSGAARPLQLDMDQEPISAGLPPHDQASPKTTGIGKHTMSHMVTDAVKDAFMEVDEEAPGGWQGWRMWNDMVRDDNTPVPSHGIRFDSMNNSQHEMSWSAYENAGMYGVDPIQDAAIHMESQAPIGADHWNFGGYR